VRENEGRLLSDGLDLGGGLKGEVDLLLLELKVELKPGISLVADF
jgi:hypothetical protein